jgi:hypothetical protein
LAITDARIIPAIQYQDILDLVLHSASSCVSIRAWRFLPVETWKKRQPGQCLLAQPLKLFHALYIKFAD